MVRKTIEIDNDLCKEIEDMADEKKWSFSYMGYVLLQQAVKERNRKRNGKKVYTGRNTTDIHQDNSE